MGLSDVVESLKFITCVLNFSNCALGQHRVDGFIIGEHGVEVGYIENVLRKFRFKFWYDLFTNKSLLINACIPWMAKNFFYSSVASKSVLRVLV